MSGRSVSVLLELVGLVFVSLALSLGGACAQPAIDEGAPKRLGPSASQLKDALDRAGNWLIDHQFEDGSYGFEVPDVGKVADEGITAMVVQALALSPRRYREDDGPFISRAVDYLLASQQDDGGFSIPSRGLRNYKSSVAILMLTTLDAGRKKPRYSAQITRARDFISGLQCSEDARIPYDRQQHKPAYGGIGYGSDRRPDLSNTQFALEALAGGLSEDSDIFKRALVFLERCQNRKQSNDLFDDEEKHRSTEDGGFMYLPGETKAETIEHEDGARSYSSYGSMTYAGLKSYIYAGLERDDPRVQAAWEWIRKNYSVETNPGMVRPGHPELGWMGYYYYLVVMARTLELLEVDTVDTPDGKKHPWASELAAHLLELQTPEGTWKNPEDRWWEGSEMLTTAYAMQALSICFNQLK